MKNYNKKYLRTKLYYILKDCNISNEKFWEYWKSIEKLLDIPQEIVDENLSLKNRIIQLENKLNEQKETETEIIQRNCNHVWGPVNWVCEIGGFRTCLKCGKSETYCERD